MHKCSAMLAPIVKGNKFGKFQSPKTHYEINQMKVVPYASAVGSIMYAQVCTRLDLAYVTEVLGRYQKNPCFGTTGKLLRKYCAICKVLKTNYMLTYRKSDKLVVVGYFDADFAGYVDDKKSTSGYIFTLRLYIHPRRRRYIVEKLQTINQCLVDNAG
jgi:hypothetical protein